MRDADIQSPVSPTPSSASSSLSPSKRTTDRRRSSTGLSNGRKRILFNLSQKNFTVTTKVFEDFGTSRTYFMALGLGGFRIVQTSAGQHAEYNGMYMYYIDSSCLGLDMFGSHHCPPVGITHTVIICMNNQTYCIWKRYSHFNDLMKQAQLAQSERHLRKSLSSWNYMESRRKWWRCLDIRYLAQKLSLIEAFLKELVYEIKSPTVLIKFASDVTSPMDGHPTTAQILPR